jgi:translation initiation factor IF-2
MNKTKTLCFLIHPSSFILHPSEEFMSIPSGNVRLYDLAKELKLDTKRVIEDVRREGLDVSVPSNSIPKEIADKIRNKYFPKKEVSTAKRAVRIVKHTRPTAEEEVSTEPIYEEVPATAEVDKPAEKPVEVTPTKAVAEPVQPTHGLTVRPIKVIPTPAKRAPKPEVEKPTEEPTVITEPEKVEEPTPIVQTEVVAGEPETEVIPEPELELEPVVEQEKPKEEPVQEKPVTPPVTTISPTGTRVTSMKLTPEVLRAAGVNLNQTTAVKPQPVQQQKQDKKEDRNRRERKHDGRNANAGVTRQTTELRGTPGETEHPIRSYIPPPNKRIKHGRNQPVRGPKDGKGGKFIEKEMIPPRPIPLAQRVRQQLGVTTTAQLKPVRLVEGATVKEFAEKLGIKPKDVVALLIQRKVFATINQPLNTDVAIEFGKRFGYSVEFVPFEEMVVEEEFEELIAADVDDVELSRAPVVTVMGHVDHGKTSLLDAIRQTDVVSGEAGGITQHIGAYSVKVPNPENSGNKRRVVFLDTPGHEAFTMMRARGAKATDVVVLVVAADDGVMPQTIEAIEHSRAANVPMVVAINKIDKPEANIERVKQELTNQGVTPIEWGGETEMVAVSAKKKENLDTLLETILLTSDLLELKASSTRLASGVVLEAKLDRGRGSVATVLVQQGTLRIGDPFIAGQISGKVRAMFNDRGEAVDEAGPATPVEVLGLQGVPQAGDAFQVVADITKAQAISQHRQMLARQNALAQTTKRGIEALGQAEVKELLVIVKADVQGSVEVLKPTLEKLSTEKVKVKVIRSGVGAITESDVLLASATQATSSMTAVVIIGFNVRPEVRAAEVAKQENVEIRLHSIIYKVEEEIRAAMVGMLDAIEKENILGHALVQEVFKITKVGTVAGCRVIDGIMKRNAHARLIRDGVVIWEGSLSSLKRFKEDAAEVRDGYECGISLEGFNDIKVNDQIEAYVIEKIAATL